MTKKAIAEKLEKESTSLSTGRDAELLSRQRNVQEFLGQVFSLGPYYSYVFSYRDLTLSQVSPAFKAIHGVDPATIGEMKDLIDLIHPDDLAFAVQTEREAFDYLVKKIGRDNIPGYKMSYNFRMKTDAGHYGMFNHQVLVLETDFRGKMLKTLNLNANISHVTKVNTYCFSLLGLAGKPSFLNLQPMVRRVGTSGLSKGRVMLTNQEKKITSMVQLGWMSVQISEELGISLETVKKHRKNILKKTGCKNFMEVVVKGKLEGWF